MKIAVIFLSALLLGSGCARVRVEAPKEPIKVDISMRLDIYQHVQKDVDAIEDIVSGAKKEDATPPKQGLLNYFLPAAYAQEGLQPEVEQAALRRRDRVSELKSWQEKGIVGEDKSGMVQARKAADNALATLVQAENSDRMVIYRALAEKNQVSIEEIKKIYAQRLQKDAPVGTPIEVYSVSTGRYEWKEK